MTGDRDQDRFVKVVRGERWQSPPSRQWCCSSWPPGKGPRLRLLSACQRAKKASGPSPSAATKLLRLKEPDVGALYVCLQVVAVSWPVVSGLMNCSVSGACTSSMWRPPSPSTARRSVLRTAGAGAMEQAIRPHRGELPQRHGVSGQISYTVHLTGPDRLAAQVQGVASAYAGVRICAPPGARPWQGGCRGSMGSPRYGRFGATGLVGCVRSSRKDERWRKGEHRGLRSAAAALEDIADSLAESALSTRAVPWLPLEHRLRPPDANWPHEPGRRLRACR
jgi:hypothetical protein